jgi:S-disulfanyl-L-cysteine oxidoreductase SoxD
MRMRERTILALLLAAGVFMQVPRANAQGQVQVPHLGQPIAPADVAPWDISIGPDGAGLPPGRGSAKEGEAVYAAQCQACHGEKGAGKPNDMLVGGMGSLAPGKAPVKTVGSYWPYATTLWDYINRAMPFDQPGLLKPPEVYAAVAYILNLNGIIREDQVIDAASLPKIVMPNRNGFILDPRPKTPSRKAN